MKAKELMKMLAKCGELQGSVHSGGAMLMAGFYAVEGSINPRKNYYYTFKRHLDAEVVAKTSQDKDIWMFSID